MFSCYFIECVILHNYINTIIMVLEKHTYYICSYTRHYITIFIRMMSVYAPLFVPTPFHMFISTRQTKGETLSHHTLVRR